MKTYLISLGAGILIGAIYAVLGVRSPAPPVVALAGLLGILIGEQAIPVAKRVFTGRSTASYVRQECAVQLLRPHACKRHPIESDA